MYKRKVYIPLTIIDANALIKAYDYDKRLYISDKEISEYKKTINEIMSKNKDYEFEYSFSFIDSEIFDQETIYKDNHVILDPDVDIDSFKEKYYGLLPEKIKYIFDNDNLYKVFDTDSRGKYLKNEVYNKKNSSKVIKKELVK